MNTTVLGNQVMQIAYSMISKDHAGKDYPNGCKEKPTGSNIIYCGAEPKTKLVLSTVSDGGAWCAAFVYYCFEMACRKLNIKNLVPKTASVLTMLNNSKGIFTIDDKPSPGCIAIRRTGSTTNKKFSNGDIISHALIVIEYFEKEKQMICVEGNTGDMVALNFYPRAGTIHEITDHKFIHAERMKGGDGVQKNYFDFKPVTAGKYTSYNEQDLASPIKEPQSIKTYRKEFK